MYKTRFAAILIGALASTVYGADQTSHDCDGHVYDKTNNLIRSVKINFGSSEKAGVERALVRIGSKMYDSGKIYGMATCQTAGDESKCRVQKEVDDDQLPSDFEFSRVGEQLSFSESANFTAAQMTCHVGYEDFEILSLEFIGTPQNPAKIGIKAVIRPKSADLPLLESCDGMVMGYNAKGSLYGGTFREEGQCQMLAGPTSDTLTIWLNGGMPQEKLEPGYYYVDIIWLQKRNSSWAEKTSLYGYKGFTVKE